VQQIVYEITLVALDLGTEDEHPELIRKSEGDNAQKISVSTSFDTLED
jgi:hypothetical protein